LRSGKNIWCTCGIHKEFIHGYIARCPANENRASMIKSVAETKRNEKEELLSIS